VVLQVRLSSAGGVSMRARGYDHGAAGAARTSALEPLAVGKRTLVEQAYNRPIPAGSPPAQSAEQAAEPSRHTEQPAEARQDAAPATDATAGERAAGPRPDPAPTAGRAVNGPAEKYLVPETRTPRSAPGEQIIFRAKYEDPAHGNYQIVFTAVGGDFTTSRSGTKSMTIPGLVTENLMFFIDPSWNKRSAVTVKMEVQKVADRSVAAHETWTFQAKTTVPTTVTQDNPETERNSPAPYAYKCGPDLNSDGKDDYVNETVLETFGPHAPNVTLAEIKPAYAKANDLHNDRDVSDHFFGTDAGSNGTFTITKGDKFYDLHGEGMPEKRDFERALVRMKEIYDDLEQTYSVEPGKPLGKYIVRRLLKPDGSHKIKKWKKT
jgi:hypothetical protein